MQAYRWVAADMAIVPLRSDGSPSASASPLFFWCGAHPVPESSGDNSRLVHRDRNGNSAPPVQGRMLFIKGIKQ
jgi:hypothetical protein